MSFKKNILSNYGGHFYTILLSITIVPLYLKYLGAAAFGLISVYMVFQTCLNFLNMGLIPALSREVACCRDNKKSFLTVKKFLRSLEIIFLFLNLLVILIVTGCSPWIAYHWLQVQDLTHTEVIHCIEIMGIIISFRLFGDLYRESILAMEQQVWLNGATIILTTMRYGGAYVLLRCVTRVPSHFFEYQLLIAAVEPILLGMKFYKLISSPGNCFLRFTISWELIKAVLPYACGLFYTAILWFLVLQADKFILSHVLPLTIYGYFGLITIISGGILQFVMPIHLALLPRMTYLFSRGEKEKMLRLYRQITQIVVVIIFPMVAIIAIFGAQVVYIWTGNRFAANWSGPILFWYALGNGFFAVTAFPFYLQSAIGKVKIQVVIDTVFSCISIPLIAFFAYHDGAKSATIAWCATRAILFFTLSTFVHNKYAPGIHYKWLVKDILPTLTAAITAVWCVEKIPINFELINRDESFIILSVFAFFVLIASAFASSICRDFFITYIRGKKDLKVCQQQG